MTEKKKRDAADVLAALLLDHGVRLAQTADGLSDDAKRHLYELAALIAALILATDVSQAGAVSALIVRITQEIENTYEQIGATSDASIRELAGIEARAIVSSMNSAAGRPVVKLPVVTVDTPVVQGAPLADWWKAQAADTAFKVAAAVRTLSAGGKTQQEVADLAQGPITNALRYAESLTNTAVQDMAHDTRQAVVGANESAVVGYEVVTVLDSRTCAQCLAYDGSTYDVDGAQTGATKLPFNGGPPFHFNCRCTLVPIFSHLTGVPGAGRPTSGMTAKKWLESRTPQQLDDLLGKGRSDLFQRGKISLPDLVSGTGKQLSLSDLREKYN